LARAGDVAAFTELMRWHEDKAYAVAYRILHDRDLAADACQDTLLEVWRRLPAFTGPVHQVRPWLLRILVNTCRDLADRERVRSHESLESWADDEMNDGIERMHPAMYDPGKGLEQVLEEEQLADLLMRAIRDLQEPYRTTLFLHNCNFGHAEIAHMTDVSEATVRSRLRRARLQARHYLVARAGVSMGVLAGQQREVDS